MAKRIQLVGHLDASELFERYRAAADRLERSQLQIIWLLTSGNRHRVVGVSCGKVPGGGRPFHLWQGEGAR